MHRAIVGWAILAVGVMASSGCSTGQHAASLDEYRAYPEEKPQAEVLDVQLLRDGPEISLTNTSSRMFGETTIWLNQEFSHVVKEIAVGETIQINLNDFRNEHGARFRAGGFFATERPKNVVLAQFEQGEDAQSLLGIVVVNGRAIR